MKLSIKARREAYALLFAAATALQTARDADPEKFTAEQETELEQKFSEMEGHKKILDADTRLAGLALAAGKVVLAEEPEGKEKFHEETQIEVIDPKKALTSEQFSELMNGWARTGQVPERFSTIITTTQSGFFLPKQVAAPLVPVVANVVRQAYSMLGVEPYTTDFTDAINLPVLDANAGGVLAQNAVSTNIGATDQDNAPTTSESISLVPAMYHSGPVWYSNLQLSAVNFDLLSANLPMMQYAKELGLESAIMAGIIADAGITQTVATATISGFTYGNLVSLDNALPKRYQFLKVIWLSKDAYIAATALVDSQGRPILTPDAQNQNLKRFNGTLVLRSDYLQTFGANKIVGVCCSLVAFKLRDCRSTQMVERYSNVPQRPSQQGFDWQEAHAWGYAPSAMATLKCPAS